MKLSANLLQYAPLLRLSDAAYRLHFNARCWATKHGPRVPCAVMANLPNAPKPKSLGKVLDELFEAGLWRAAGDGYDLVLDELTSKRAVAGRQGGLAKASKLVASASDLPGVCQENATDPSPTPPQTLSEVSEGNSESSSLLSSPSRPESKRARVKRKVPKTSWPADFDETIRPRVFEWARGEKYPDWWTDDRLAQMKLDCEAKGLMYERWLAAATGWLNREAKQYGNGPDAIFARRQRNGKPPGLLEHERRQAEERLPAQYTYFCDGTARCRASTHEPECRRAQPSRKAP